MARAGTYARLGLFVVLGALAALATAFGLGARSLEGETVTVHTYLDESVAGLEEGAPVRYRGISIGTVGTIGLAPDRRHVDLTLDLRAERLRHAGIAEEVDGGGTRLALHPDLRAQLGTQGITGVKYLALDFVEGAPPPPKLPFEVAAGYVPAAPSFMRSLEENVGRAVAKLPEIADATLETLRAVEGLVADLHRAGLPERAAETLRGVDRAVDDLRRVLASVDRARLPQKTAAAIDAMHRAAERVDAILARIDGEAGLLSSAQRAADAVGDVGRSAAGSSAELDRTLRDLSEAAQAIRELAESLEREPDMLLQGRGRPR